MQKGSFSTCWQFSMGFLLCLGVYSASESVSGAQEKAEENYFDRVARSLRDKESDRGNRVEFATELAEDSDAIRLVPALTNAIRKDPESNVRAAAIKCLALIEKSRKSFCPTVIVDSMLEANEEVRDAASMWAMIFDQFSEDSIDSLAKCAQSKDPELRSDAITYLSRTASKEQRVLDIIKRGTQDKNSLVAHNSQVALFTATDDMQTFLFYLIPLRNSAILSEGASAKKAKGQEAAIRSLHEFGAKMLIDRWATERPKQLADSTYALLQDKSVEIRLGVCLIIETYAGKSSEAANLVTELNELAKSGVEGKSPADFVKSLARHNTTMRLQSLVDSDPDESVRGAAMKALQCLKKAEETLLSSAPKK